MIFPLTKVILLGFSIPPLSQKVFTITFKKKSKPPPQKEMAEDFNTLPKFNSSPLTHGAWKTIFSYWVFGDFSRGELLNSGRVNCISGGLLLMKSDFSSSTF